MAEDRPVQLTAARRPERNLRDALCLPAPRFVAAVPITPNARALNNPFIILAHASFIIILVRCLKRAHYPACHTSPHYLTHLQVPAWDQLFPI